ncbi:hypothetical protein MuYL_3959 [Mucilaginibacter xinganensis]|uniref:Uncharacterized protein n=1 Tax=Mucilaginibacter xinganensis TaxID=1234841 RepID=A0A223P1N0_9SPHI|nr:hypothetical protein MuYL_3959 [Mucilaginibacter xinganensis]
MFNIPARRQPVKNGCMGILKLLQTNGVTEAYYWLTQRRPGG